MSALGFLWIVLAIVYVAVILMAIWWGGKGVIWLCRLVVQTIARWAREA
jgi:hypothetical protein